MRHLFVRITEDFLLRQGGIILQNFGQMAHVFREQGLETTKNATFGQSGIGCRSDRLQRLRRRAVSNMQEDVANPAIQEGSCVCSVERLRHKEDASAADIRPLSARFWTSWSGV
ncbi:MAG: hypothetical protein JJ992_12070, partial [Planctomycetes bacterium]|nr:hypothetical protein [Planctomycetota bacterium]